MNNITDKEIEKLEKIMSDISEAHNLLAKTVLSKEEYNPISQLLVKAKVELFNFYQNRKAALSQDNATIKSGFIVRKGYEVNSILIAALRCLNMEQKIELRDNLIERTPNPNQ